MPLKIDETGKILLYEKLMKDIVSDDEVKRLYAKLSRDVTIPAQEALVKHVNEEADINMGMFFAISIHALINSLSPILTAVMKDESEEHIIHDFSLEATKAVVSMVKQCSLAKDLAVITEEDNHSPEKIKKTIGEIDKLLKENFPDVS